jgi:hypothetical protein
MKRCKERYAIIREAVKTYPEAEYLACRLRSVADEFVVRQQNSFPEDRAASEAPKDRAWSIIASKASADERGPDIKHKGLRLVEHKTLEKKERTTPIGWFNHDPVVLCQDKCNHNNNVQPETTVRAAAMRDQQAPRRRPRPGTGPCPRPRPWAPGVRSHPAPREVDSKKKRTKEMRK